MKRMILGALALSSVTSCGRWFHRDAPDADVVATSTAPSTAPTTTFTPMIAPRDGGLSPAALASALLAAEDEEEEAVDAGGTCPMPIHPNYCRRTCRNFVWRTSSMHARRIGNPLRAGRGTCGAYKVFAEDERGADGGVSGGLVEYFDATTNELVGAVDSRSHGCGKFGTIPTCKLEIDWGAPAARRGGGLGDIPVRQ